MTQDFLDFLTNLSEGHCTPEDWGHFVVTHYKEQRLEAARVELVRASISLREWPWHSVPEALRRTASELRAGT